MQKVKLSDLDELIEVYVDKASKQILLRGKEGFSVMIEVMGDYALNVNGDVMMNQNGLMYLSSMHEGESIGMTLDEVREECQSRYAESMKAMNAATWDVTTEEESREIHAGLTASTGCNI